MTRSRVAAQALRVFREGVTARRLRSMIDFAETEMILYRGPKSGTRWKADSQPFSLLLLRELCSARWRRRVVTGPSQSGKTYTGFNIPLNYHLFEMREDVICGVPSMDMVADKWAEDIRPAMESSNFRHLLPSKGPGSRGGTPRKVQFAHGPSLTFMTAGGGDKGRAGASARVLVVTETDGFDETGGSSRETDKLRQLEARVRSHGLNSLTYMECTVSTESGRTWREYKEGSESRIIVPCRHCGHWITPEREDLHGWEEAETKLEAGRKAFFACPDCGGAWTDADREVMNRECRLIHRGQEVTEGGEIVGEIADTDTLGFRWNAFNNLFTPVAQLGMEEWTAKRDEAGDAAELQLKQFVWCIPAKDESVERSELSVGVVRGSAQGYAGRCSGMERGAVPDGTQCLTAAIDIGRRVLRWEVKAWLPTHSHVVDYGDFETGQPDVVGDAVAITDALHELTRRLESRFQINSGLVDCGNWREVILEWIRGNARGIWRASHGMSNYVHPKGKESGVVPSPDRLPWHMRRDNGVFVVNFDPDRFKRAVHSAFTIRPLDSDGNPQSGRVSMFGSEPLSHDEFARQVTAEIWKTEFKKDKSSKTAIREGYVKTRKDNHMLDCEVMNAVARSVASIQRERISLSAIQKSQQGTRR